MLKKPASNSNSATSKPPIYKRKWFIAIVVLLVLGMLFGGSDENDSKNADSESAQETSVQGNVENEQAGAELVAVTDRLEYSNKEVDPLTLVEASAEDAEVSAEGRIDLKTVGVQAVTYAITSNGQTATQTLEFTVHDTKAPVIKLADESPSIDQGDAYDFFAAVSSVEDEVDGPLEFDEGDVPAQGASAGIEVLYDQGWYTFEGDVDSATPGTYPVKVVASDKHGNVSSKEFVVTVREPAQAEASTQTPAAATHTYVLNTNTGKFHVSGCSSANRIKDSNRGEITGMRDEVISMGYEPCGRCNP